MELTWRTLDKLDGPEIAGAVSVVEAARAVDSPYMMGWTLSSYAGRLRHGWDGDAPLIAVTRDEDDRVTGVGELVLPQWDNRHIALFGIAVDPAARRRGLGRALFHAAVEEARARGRTVIMSECAEGSAGEPFFPAMGLARAYVAVQRRQDLRAVDWDWLDEQYADAQRHAEGYDLVRLPGAVPDELLPDIVTMTEAINDAPTDELDVEDEVFSPERVRLFEAAHAARNRRLYRIVARQRDTGVLAGHTVVGVDAERPWHGWQYDTSVVRAHRGHRLGLLLKIAMMRWLREDEPQVRTVDTTNAASNRHMIQVNEAIGYRVVGRMIEWQRRLDAA
ncbi:MAG TPA: GNAT family N-acetyltransferase [Pilimelia sp.]|nr:GNAT family N-acetyltransferase [Pilimelia sp.]